MAPGDQRLQDIAVQAERDVNTYKAKIGDDNAMPDKKFPGAELRYDEDLSTNRGYNKRIPPVEGGELDARGRQTRGEHFEGQGGPREKVEQQAREFGGEDTYDPTGKRTYEPGARDASVQYDHSGRDPLPVGQEAVQSNLENSGRTGRKPQFKGSEYYVPEDVPDSGSALGNIPPENLNHSSRQPGHF